METINFVVIGYGGMGGYHARELIQEKDGVQVIGVYDIDEKRLEVAKNDNFKTYHTLESVLNDKSVEAVLIATPNASHKAFANSCVKSWQTCCLRKTSHDGYKRVRRSYRSSKT